MPMKAMRKQNAVRLTPIKIGAHLKVRVIAKYGK